MDFAVIAAAGLTQAEFAEVAGVSRITVNSWVRGKMRPHRYIKLDVEALLVKIEAALHNKVLPLAANIVRDHRVAAVLTALS